MTIFYVRKIYHLKHLHCGQHHLKLQHFLHQIPKCNLIIFHSLRLTTKKDKSSPINHAQNSDCRSQTVVFADVQVGSVQIESAIGSVCLLPIDVVDVNVVDGRKLGARFVLVVEAFLVKQVDCRKKINLVIEFHDST